MKIEAVSSPFWFAIYEGALSQIIILLSFADKMYVTPSDFEFLLKMKIVSLLLLGFN